MNYDISMMPVYSREISSMSQISDRSKLDYVFKENVNVATKLDNKCGLQLIAPHQCNISWMDSCDCLFVRNLL